MQPEGTVFLQDFQIAVAGEFSKNRSNFFGREAQNICKLLSTQTAVLEGVQELSLIHIYVEPDGTIRLYFTLEQAQVKLHRSRQSATRIFRELEYSGLIIRKKQGLGKPALITLNYPSDARFIAKEGEDAQA